MTTKKHLISRAEFARRANRGRSTITEACRGPLAQAIVRKRIDAAHPHVVAWARERGIDPVALTSQRRAARPPSAAAPVPSAAPEAPEAARHGFGGPLTAVPEGTAIPEWASAASPAEIVAALQAGIDYEIDRGVEQGRRLLQFEGDLFDLDHPAVRRFLERELGETMTPELLDELWEELEDHRAARRESGNTQTPEAS